MMGWLVRTWALASFGLFAAGAAMATGETSGAATREISDTPLRTDRSYLTLLTLSPLAFLLFPLLGLVGPLTLWLIKRETIAGVNEAGRRIVNFQITWLLLLGAGMVLFFYQPFFHTEVFWMPNPLQYSYFLYTFYGWNIFRTIVNAIRVGRSKPAAFGMAIPFIRA